MRFERPTCMKCVSALVGLTAIVVATMQPAWADEGGVSFWLPGQFGSLAAVPGAPGWSLGTVYFHSASDEGLERTTLRGGRIVAGVEARADLVFIAPTYTFVNPVLGGQAAFSVIGALGRLEVDVGATLTRPGGSGVSASRSDALTAGSDLYGLGTVKWNHGVHNTMTYLMFGIPVGAYRSDRLANIGIGHGSIDAGGGYTYFDKKNEFSVVAGLTYNFENKDTDYQNGIDGHIDWAASRFIDSRTHVGVVGYIYHQLSGDSGSGARLGDYKSRVMAIGPQIGHLFQVGEQHWYLNLKGYYEFEAKNRPQGWNVWVTLAVPLGTPHKQ